MAEQRTIEKKVRLSRRTVISKAQYMQLVGLKAAHDKQESVRKAIEAAAYDITQELERGSDKPATCGHTTDWLFDSRDLDEMLDLIGVKVRK